MTYDITFCEICEHWYSAHLNECPVCERTRAQQRVTAPSASVASADSTSGAYMTYSAYKADSPHKVSKEEYTRYQYLWACLQGGYISNLRLQVAYPLIDAIQMPADSFYRVAFKQGAQSYSPDFVYCWQGYTVIEEYKAVRYTKKTKQPKPRMTTVARNKHKLFLHRYRDKLLAGDWLFLIVGMDSKLSRWQAFDPNGNTTPYMIEDTGDDNDNV